MPQLMHVHDLREWFRGSVGEAATRRQLAIEEHTEHYVVNLLTLFSRSEHLHASGSGGRRGPRPLGLMLAEAMDEPTAERRAAQLQHLGDVSLFFAGFFTEFLHRHSVDIEYYVRMGGGAYATLADAPAPGRRVAALADTFRELADKFLGLVDVLNDIADGDRPPQGAETLRLYEQWLRTGSPRAAERLRALGVIPSSFATSDRAQ